MMMMREGRLIEKHGLQYQTLCHLLLPRACFLHKKKVRYCAGAVWFVAAVVDVSALHGQKNLARGS